MIWHRVAKRGPFVRETGDELHDHAGSKYPTHSSKGVEGTGLHKGMRERRSRRRGKKDVSV